MKKKDLITKWLNNEQLTPQELEAFKQLDAYDSYVKISETATQFKAPDYDTTSSWETLSHQLTTTTTHTKPKTSSLFRIALQVAAALVVGISIIYISFFSTPALTQIATLATEQQSIQLPDNSTVQLNAVSTIAYNESQWETTRKVTLAGEGFFKVAKGKKFDVQTTVGTISVIGTEFNVKQRDSYFSVSCFEGMVSVAHGATVTYLKAGETLEVIDQQSSKKTLQQQTSPTWLTHRSTFTSAPYEQVLQELAWQYGITITTKNIDKTMRFTGNFVHSNIETALQSITIPMHITYTIRDKEVTLHKE